MADLLIVAAPTVDYIAGEPRPGGPGLYGGLAASLLGCRARVLGPLGLEDYWVARVYEKLGIEYLGPLTPSCGYRFVHDYQGETRDSRILCRPRPLGPHDTRLVATRHDAVLVSPVECEVTEAFLASLASINPGYWVLDIQGYTRCYGELWPHVASSLPLTPSLVHVSLDDTPSPPRLRGVVSYTMGVKGGLLLVDGVEYSRLPPPPIVVGDPTGAGDVYTSVVACLVTRGVPPLEAAVEASRITPTIIARLKALLGFTNTYTKAQP